MERLVGGTAAAGEAELPDGGETGARAGSAAPQATVAGVADTAAGRLDVSLGSGTLLGILMVEQSIQARQAGPRREEYGQEEGSAGPREKPAPCRAGTMHEVDNTQTRSAVMLRLTGPSVGSTNQKAAPFPYTESAPMVPPCISTNFLQRARPNPVP